MRCLEPVGGDAEECIVAQQVGKQQRSLFLAVPQLSLPRPPGGAGSPGTCLRFAHGRASRAQWDATVRPGGPDEVADSATFHTQIESNTAAELLDCLAPDDAERETMLQSLFSEPSLDDDDDYGI